MWLGLISIVKHQLQNVTSEMRSLVTTSTLINKSLILNRYEIKEVGFVIYEVLSNIFNTKSFKVLSLVPLYLICLLFQGIVNAVQHTGKLLVKDPVLTSRHCSPVFVFVFTRERQPLVLRSSSFFCRYFHD